MKKFAFLVVALATVTTPLLANSWTGNLNDAKKKAASQSKDLLIYFSGATWDKWTKTLEKEILEKEAFKKEAPQKFILVNFDLPSNARKDPASAPKVEIANKYGIKRLPAIILADQKGRPYAMTGYQKGSAEEFLKHLNELKTSGAKLKKALSDAQGKKGEEKAKALIAALKLAPKNAWGTHYVSELDAIKSADPKGKTGFIAKLEKEAAIQKEQKHYQMLFSQKKFDKVIKESSAAIAKTSGEDAQRIYMYNVQALAGLKKYSEAKKALEAMGKLAPESELGKSVDRYKQIVDRIKARDERQANALAKGKGKAPKKKPTGPIVSKPVAVVSDVKILHDEVKDINAQLKKAIAEKEAKAKAKQEVAAQIVQLQKQLADLKAKEANVTKEAKKAAETQAKLNKKLAAMKDVIATHEEMESRKKQVTELEKKAKELQKQAEELRKKASGLKAGSKK